MSIKVPDDLSFADLGVAADPDNRGSFILTPGMTPLRARMRLAHANDLPWTALSHGACAELLCGCYEALRARGASEDPVGEIMLAWKAGRH